VLVEPDQRRLHAATAWQISSWGPLGPLGGVDRLASVQRGSAPHRRGSDRDAFQPAGHDYDGRTDQTQDARHQRSTVPLPYGLDPQRVPIAGSYTTGAQQQSKAGSAWYQYPDRTTGIAGVVAAAGKDRRQQRAAPPHRRPDVVLEYGEGRPER